MSIIIIIIIILATPHSLWDTSSLTRDETQVPYCGSSES